MPETTTRLPLKSGKPGPQLIGPPGWSVAALTFKQRDTIDNYLRRQTAAPLESVALVCQGSSCPYSAHCPLYQEDPSLVPIGGVCPIELSLAEMWLEEYKTALEIRDVDIVDVAILKEYIGWMLFSRRAQQEMATDPKILRKEFAGVDMKGHVLMTENMNPIFVMLEKSSKRQQKLMESLLATREAKMRADGNTATSFSTFLTVLMERVEEKKKAKTNTTRVLDTSKIQGRVGVVPLTEVHLKSPPLYEGEAGNCSPP